MQMKNGAIEIIKIIY